MVSGSRCCTGISVNVSASSARPYNTWPRNPPSFDSNAKHAANSRLHCSLECTLNLCCFDLPPPAPPALFGRARGKIFRVNTRANVKSKHAKNSMIEWKNFRPKKQAGKKGQKANQLYFDAFRWPMRPKMVQLWVAHHGIKNKIAGEGERRTHVWKKPICPIQFPCTPTTQGGKRRKRGRKRDGKKRA